jgi:F0F1-type ATP synthase membrane subunit b/b'
MNTETLNLITGVVEEIIAAIPQIVVVLTTVVYSLNAIKAKVNSFPIQIKETKETVDTNLKETKDSINASLSQSQNKMSNIVEDMRQEIVKQVGETLVNMEKEMASYKEQLSSNSDQVNILVRQNKMFTDVIATLVAKDPKLIQDGVAKNILQRTNLSKEDLENYPQLLIKELPRLEGALKEALLVLGKEKFEEVLGKAGYGKDH